MPQYYTIPRGRSKTLIEKWEKGLYRTHQRKLSTPILPNESSRIVSELVPHWNELIKKSGFQFKPISFREYQRNYQIASGIVLPTFRNYQKLYSLKTDKKQNLITKLMSLRRNSKPKSKKVPNWKEVMSSEGHIYYWNTFNQKTQYEKPDEEYQPLPE